MENPIGIPSLAMYSKNPVAHEIIYQDYTRIQHDGSYPIFKGADYRTFYPERVERSLAVNLNLAKPVWFNLLKQHPLEYLELLVRHELDDKQTIELLKSQKTSNREELVKRGLTCSYALADHIINQDWFDKAYAQALYRSGIYPEALQPQLHQKAGGTKNYMTELEKAGGPLSQRRRRLLSNHGLQVKLQAPQQHMQKALDMVEASMQNLESTAWKTFLTFLPTWEQNLEKPYEPLENLLAVVATIHPSPSK